MAAMVAASTRLLALEAAVAAARAIREHQEGTLQLKEK